MVRVDSHERLLMSWYSGIYPTGLILFKYGTITLYGSAFQPSSSKNKFCNLIRCLTEHQRYTLQHSTATVPVRMLQKVCSQRDRTFVNLHAEFGLLPFRSPLLRELLSFSFLPVTEMFHFTGLPPYTYLFSIGYHVITHDGFPHSEIPGF
jgi:hypothetical protein